MGTALLSFFSRDWAGLALAALPGAFGTAFLAADTPRWLTVIGIVLVVAATIMAMGALIHLVHVARIRSRYPAPGTLVDVGGTRLHVLAEGESNDRPSVVWFAGGHAAGYALHHLHRVLRQETRSILIDRPGTGWSDVGPFPRTTAREADEVIAALKGAGEKGPFVFAGHSFGGLLAANIARRWPEATAAVVMIDATPADTIIYGPKLPGLRQMRLGALLNALPRLFGIHIDFAERKQRRTAPPAYRRVVDLVDETLGEAGRTLKAVECGTKNACASASIFAELTAEGLAAAAWDTVVYEGDLGDLPVVLVAPKGMDEAEFEGVAGMIDAERGPDDPIDRERLARFYERSRERYLTISSRSRRVVAPEGTGHNFPYEVPEFLIDTVRSALAIGDSTSAGKGRP